MNDIRRTVLWMAFGFSMVMLWDQWQVYNGKKPTFFPPAPTQVSAAQTAQTPPQTAPAAANVSNTAATSAAPADSAAAPVVPKERFEVRSDVLALTFDTEGGTLVRAELLQHTDMVNKQSNVVLLDETAQRHYVAQSGVIAAQTTGTFPTHKTVMTVSGDRAFKEGQNELTLRFTSPVIGGVELVKTYTIARNSYAIAVKHEVLNQSTAPVAAQVYLQLERDGDNQAQKIPAPAWLQTLGVHTMPSFYSTFTGPAIYTDAKKYQKAEFEDIKKKNVDYEKEATDGYVAMVQHYFASAWILKDVKRSFSLEGLDTGSTVPNCCYRATMMAPLESIAPGASRALDATFFVGPQDEKMLESLAPGLELVKDYGSLKILAKPLYWLLEKLHGLIQNWGWSIVALVLLLKIAFYWLNAKAYASMAKMKAVNPRIMAMRERLKDNPQQMQQEMMKMYREEKVNPLGGCIPILIQIPVFIALYSVLLASVEMRNAPWMLWIQDLSSPDPYFILPLVMTLTTLLQTALNPAPPDPLQAKMMWIMPLVFSIMFFFFPAGLVIYWITNNILSIAQQWIINTRMGVPPQFNLPKFS
jgi:YidC/Oxa1 family membrane protein insertase